MYSTRLLSHIAIEIKYHINLLLDNIQPTRCTIQLHQSGRSPKVVALFLLQTLVAIWYDFFNCLIQSKWTNHTGINYNHNDITSRSHVIYNNVQNSIFATKFRSIYLTKGQKRLVFQLSFVNLQRAKDGTHMFDAKYRYFFVVKISPNRTLGITPNQSLIQGNVYRVTRKCH